MKPLYVYLAVIIYFTIGTAVAFYARTGLAGRGMADFFLANRSVNGVIAALTYSATTYSAFMLVGLAGFTYVGGVGAWGFELIYLCGLALAAFFGPRFWFAGKRYGYVTPADMLGDRYESKNLAVVTAVASIIFLVPYSAVQLIGIGALMEGLSGGAIPFMAGLVIATVIAVAWAWMGGMRAVALTDSLQATVMMIVAVLSVLFIVYRAFGGFDGFITRLETEIPQWLAVPGPGFFNFKAFIGLSMPWMFFCLSNPQVSQRLFIPRSLGHMRTMIMGFLVFGFIYTLVSITWGFSARLLMPGLDSGDMATPQLLGSEYVPVIVALIVMMGITAAAISTINSIILTLSSMISRDVYRSIKPGAGEDKELAVGKIFVPLFALAAFLFATLRLDLIAALSVASSAGLLVTVPAIIGAFFWKKGSAQGAVTSIVAGGIAAFVLQFTGIKPLGLWPGIWSGIISTVLFVGVSLFTRAPEEKAEEFMGYVNQSIHKNGAI